MLQGVTYLDIKPFAEISTKETHKTTITSFEDMLKAEETEKESADETVQDSVSSEETAATDTDGQTIIYKDPVTGKEVVYEDVAKSDTSESKTSSTSKTSSSSKTTETADSMKKTKYDAYFKAAAKKYNVSESLLKGIAKAESNFNANDVSSSGAMGVMQLMPATAKELGVTDAYDPEQNIMGGAKCIAQKLKEFNGDVKLALAAYNAGSGAVKKNGGVPSYCKSYVSKVLSYKSAFETASAVG
jgi:membrane-bound lytic murein transglycosylase B